MKPREKLLAGGLVGVLVLWQGGLILDTFVFGPVQNRESDIAARDKSVFAKQRELRLSEAAARNLKDWNQRSLPPDPVVATSLYQNWLIELAAKTKLDKVVVTPQHAVKESKGDTYYVISATIKAQGTFERLCDFLYEFRRSGLLHRIRSMTLTTDEHKGDPKLDITLAVEGLGLKDAPARTTLFSDPNLADLPGDKPARDRKTYSDLLKKNLFVRGYNGPPRPTPPPGGRDSQRPTPATTPAEDPREFVYFVGSFSSGGAFDATLYDRLNNKTSQLLEGSDFKVAGVEGKVISIGVDFVTFKIKGDDWRLELGDNLAQMKKTGAPRPAGSPDAG